MGTPAAVIETGGGGGGQSLLSNWRVLAIGGGVVLGLVILVMRRSGGGGGSSNVALRESEQELLGSNAALALGQVAYDQLRLAGEDSIRDSETRALVLGAIDQLGARTAAGQQASTDRIIEGQDAWGAHLSAKARDIEALQRFFGDRQATAAQVDGATGYLAGRIADADNTARLYGEQTQALITFFGERGATAAQVDGATGYLAGRIADADNTVRVYGEQTQGYLHGYAADLSGDINLLTQTAGRLARDFRHLDAPKNWDAPVRIMPVQEPGRWGFEAAGVPPEVKAS